MLTVYIKTSGVHILFIFMFKSSFKFMQWFYQQCTDKMIKYDNKTKTKKWKNVKNNFWSVWFLNYDPFE